MRGNFAAHHINLTTSISQYSDGLLGQTSIGPRNIYIFGVGDGALIDLCRAKVSGFRQDRVIEEFLSDQTTLAEGLRDLGSARQSGVCDGPTWLYDRFVALKEQGLLNELDERLRSRERTDVRASIFAIPQNFREALSRTRGSLVNALFAHRMIECGLAEYQQGSLRGVRRESGTIIATVAQGSDVTQYTGGTNNDLPCDEVVIRYGTEPLKGLRDAGCMGNLEKYQQELLTRRDDTGREPLWRPGWWSEQVRTKGSGTPAPRIEFVPPATVTIATTFVATLSSIIAEQGVRAAKKSGESDEFRMTLHRWVYLRGEDWLQQVAHYRGTAKTRVAGEVGRVFGINHGVIGLCARTRKAIVVNRYEDFQQGMSRLQFESLNAAEIHPKVESILAVPFLSREGGVVLVLFMDSFQKDFFGNQRLRLIADACKGFKEDLDHLVENSTSELRFISANGAGVNLEGSIEDDNRVNELHSVKYSTSFPRRLRFRQLNSFDITWRG